MFELRVITSSAHINWLPPKFGGRNDLVFVFHQSEGAGGATLGYRLFGNLSAKSLELPLVGSTYNVYFY